MQGGITMENQTEGKNTPDMQQIMKLARTPAGQQLIAALRQRGGDDLAQAMQKASAGDYTDAKRALSTLLDTPEMKALMQQFGR
jgi:hypothetical protein